MKIAKITLYKLKIIDKFVKNCYSWFIRTN